MLNAQGRVTDWNKKVIQAEADVRKTVRHLKRMESISRKPKTQQMDVLPALMNSENP